MTVFGVTGHQGIPASAIPYIRQGIRELLEDSPGPIEGYSSLAVGADQLFAEELLQAGGLLHAVIPARNYESTFDDLHRAAYQGLLDQASSVSELPFPQPSEEAYDAAGKWIADHAETVIAIWDGQEARGLGGTGDAVRHAQELGKEIQIIWPAGVDRE